MYIRFRKRILRICGPLTKSERDTIGAVRRCKNVVSLRNERRLILLPQCRERTRCENVVSAESAADNWIIQLDYRLIKLPCSLNSLEWNLIRNNEN